MQKLLLINACLFILSVSEAQPDSAEVKKQKTFIVLVKTMDSKSTKGNLATINQGQLVLNSFSEQQFINAENIKSFTLKRKNSVLKGALIGLGVGALTGVIIGFASGDDPVMSYPDPNDDFFGLGTFATAIHNAFAMTAGQKAAAGGLLMGTSSAIVGTIIGAVARKKFIIGGKKEKFYDLQSELMTKLIKK